jgi:phosphoenolpyruvate carboxykinase (GTP)
VYKAATMGSETTAASAGAVGEVRRDPFAMLPFCGYHVGDYFGHWLAIGRRLAHPPRIFAVNWFRKGADGRFLWPGFGENMRVLRWIVERCQSQAGAIDGVVGQSPGYDDLDWTGLQFSRDDYRAVMDVDPGEWASELAAHDELFARIGPRVPRELLAERRALGARLRVSANSNAAAPRPPGATERPTGRLDAGT